MNQPRLMTVDGAYQYLMGLLLVLAIVLGAIYSAMYLGFLSF